jgi:hypothetical protein
VLQAGVDAIVRLWPTTLAWRRDSPARRSGRSYVAGTLLDPASTGNLGLDVVGRDLEVEATVVEGTTVDFVVGRGGLRWTTGGATSSATNRHSGVPARVHLREQAA